MAKLIDGKKIAAEVREDIRARAAEFTEKTGIVPGLAVIIVGEDPASKVYVRNKKKACVEAGFHSEVIEMPADTKMPELLSKIEELKQDDAIHGILVQLPLPAGLDEQAVIAAIPPEKDVDAFHVVNTGRIMLGDYDFLPCTPAGVMKLLEHEGVDVCGKECVVVGRSNIVGKPQAMLLLHANGTVTVCHSKTKNLAEITRRADILVVAIGRADFITTFHSSPVCQPIPRSSVVPRSRELDAASAIAAYSRDMMNTVFARLAALCTISSAAEYATVQTTEYMTPRRLPRAIAAASIITVSK